MSATKCLVSMLVGAGIAGYAMYVTEHKKCELRITEAREEALKFYLEELQKIPEEVKDISMDGVVAQQAPPEIEEEEEEAVSSEESDKSPIPAPYPIPSIQYGRSGNEQIMLTYYADGVVVDENYKVLAEDDIIDFVGSRNFVRMFGDYGELGVIHIRNERLETDFEIEQDPRNWRDFKKNLPSFPTGKGPFDDDIS